MRRFLITCVAIMVVIFSAMGVESLIMGDHNSILRQTLTSPVKQIIDGSRINSNQVVVAIDTQIDPLTTISNSCPAIRRYRSNRCEEPISF